MNQQLYLSDEEIRDNLFPFTLTRSAADIRIGILTIREKWAAYLGRPVSLTNEETSLPGDAAIVSANVVPSAAFVASLLSEKGLNDLPDWSTVKIIQYPWHIFQWNDWAIREDYQLLTSKKVSQPIPESVQSVRSTNIFIEDGAKLSHCIINAQDGPVYIGKNAEIMEGATVRGPLALCEGAVIKMGARIYGATTIGPYSVVGGEVKNSVIFGYSNKAHDGYLGDSVIAEWCNLGAGTSNSNLKNNASEIKMYSHIRKEMISSGLMKCGLIMGDYSRCSINTSFNTGTTVGICANIFGNGLTPKYIPNFTWGNDTLSRYEFSKALDDIDRWKKLKGSKLSENEKNRLRLIFDEN